MKKSAISEIFDAMDNGQLLTNMSNLSEAASDFEQELLSKLPPDFHDSVNSLIDYVAKSCCDENEQYFAMGFKLGVRIGFECG